MLYLPFSRLINLGIPAQVGRFRAVNVLLNKLSTATIAKSRMNLTHAHFKQRPQCKPRVKCQVGPCMKQKIKTKELRIHH